MIGIVLNKRKFMKVEVFKTDVCDTDKANELLQDLNNLFPGYQMNFDLQDCDHILRIAATEEVFSKAKRLLHQKGHQCVELPE